AKIAVSKTVDVGSSPTTPASLKLKTLKNALYKVDLRVFLLPKSRFLPVLANFLANNSKKIIFFTFRNELLKGQIKIFL
ncbi:MAG: hypothetical protein ACLTK8_07790, partial [Paeniclostridium sp.]